MTGDEWGRVDNPDFPEKPEETGKEKYERLLKEARKRGGTPKGKVVVTVVNGRRLS